jgi:serine/threonine protein kinase
MSDRGNEPLPSGPTRDPEAAAPPASASTTDLDPRQPSVPTRGDAGAGTGPELGAGGKQPWTFGRYQVERLLGRGGMGEVFLAQDTLLHRAVALKIPRLAEGRPEQRERFLREARAAAGLAHANICPVYDVGEIDGRPYLTMAYINGPSLAVCLAQTGPFAPTEAARLVAEIARAMQHAHDQGILHRDLKPANIMLNAAGQPIVMDFGLAFKLAESDSGERLTEQGLIVGTPAYMPPEQINSQPLGPTADVYSLGMVLYELLTGRVAFQAPLGKLMAQIESTPPPPPSEFRPGLESMLEGICLKALAKKPQDRFAGMTELAEALADYGEGKDRPDLSATTLLFRRPRRRWLPGGLAWPALAAGVSVLIASAILLWPRQEPIPDDTNPPAPRVDNNSPVPKTDNNTPVPKIEPQTELDKLFAQVQRPILRFEAVANKDMPLRLARDMIPKKFLAGHKGLVYFVFSGSGKGHVVDLSDQSGQGMQIFNFSEGDVTVRGSFFSFLSNLGDSAQIFVKGGPAFSLLAPLANGRGSTHVEFDGTHLILPKPETGKPAIDQSDAGSQDLALLRNTKLTRKLTLRYQTCTYVVYTRPGIVVVPGDQEERRVDFPEIHNLIELERKRQYSARTVTNERLVEALEEVKKKK